MDGRVCVHMCVCNVLYIYMCVWYTYVTCHWLMRLHTQSSMVTFLDMGGEYKSLNEISIVIIYYWKKKPWMWLTKYSSSELYSPHSICFMLTLIFLLANGLCIHVYIIQHISIISTHINFQNVQYLPTCTCIIMIHMYVFQWHTQKRAGKKQKCTHSTYDVENFGTKTHAQLYLCTVYS